MRSQVKLGRVFGIELGLHYSWIIIAVLIAFSLAAHFHQVNPEWGEGVIWGAAVLTAVLFFAALVAHELAHSVVARRHGLPIRGITLFALGGVSQIERDADNAGTEFIMAIVGPLTSLVIGLACLGGAYAARWSPRMTPGTPELAILVWLGYINLALAAFNMIPGYPLDGGRVLRSIVWGITRDRDRATRAAARIGQVVAALFIAYGIFQFFAGAGLSGLWMALIGWFLLQSAGASYTQVEAFAALRGLSARDLMSRDCPRVDGNLDLAAFVDSYLLHTGQRCFIVVDDGRLAGLLTPHEIRTVDRIRWPELKLKDVMRPFSRVHVISSETPVSEALEIMGREDVNQLPVVENGHLEGVLSRANVMQALRSRAELAA